MPKTTDLRRKVLAILSRHAGLTVNDIAKQLRVRPHLVRHSLRRLIETGNLTRSALIDSRRLGYSIYNLFFDILPNDVAAVISFFKSRPEVAWLTENSGARRYEVTLHLKFYWQLDAILDELGDATDSHLRDPLFAMPGNAYHWGLRFLEDGWRNVPPLCIDKPTTLFTADHVDLSILRTVRELGEVSPSDISRRIGVPATTIKYRYDRLQRAGVISSDVYFLTREVPDLIHAQFLIRMSSRGARHREALLSFCQNCPHVEQLISCVGQWDYKITVYADAFKGILAVEDKLGKQLGNSVANVSLYIRRQVLRTSLGIV